jgi:hypothetical protein
MHEFTLKPVLRNLARTLVAGAAAGLLATPALADSTPVGPLPPGPVSTTATPPGSLFAVALPRRARSTGLVWRVARPIDSAVLKQVSEADVGKNVVVVFRVVGRGEASLVFALTRGDSSSKALRAITYRIRAG